MNTTTATALATIPAAIGAAFGGGIYAGISRGVDGAPDQHLVLMPGEAVDVDWEAAGAFAASVGGELPTRAEQALLYANLKDQFEPRWYWSGDAGRPLSRVGSGFQRWRPGPLRPLVRGPRPRRPQIANLIYLSIFSHFESPA